MQQLILTKQDLTYLSWSKTRKSSGTAGSFLKSSSEMGGGKTYYKLSNYDAFKGITGHECVNELIVDRLLGILGVEHLPYQLIYADILVDEKVLTTYLCASEDFKKPGESKTALDALYQIERHENESPLAFCKRMGWAEFIYQMLAVDFIILNRDRHGANIEVLRSKKNRMIRPAPLFDHGLSLIFNCTDESSVNAFDEMDDKPVQCFVGSKSAYENLKMIPAESIPIFNPLKESDRSVLFEGLENALPDVWLNKIWETLLKRWNYYADFCNQRRT